MKKSLIAILALGLFAAMAQAGTFLTNPVPIAPYNTPSNTLAALEQGGAQVNGGVFSIGPDGLQISDFEAWLVDQSSGPNGTPLGAGAAGQYAVGSVSAPTGSLGLYLADLSGPATWQNSGWTASYSRFMYTDGSNYYSSNYSAGNYLPIWAIEWSGGGSSINLNANDTYAWAVTGLNTNVAGALLLDSQAACTSTYNGDVSDCNPLGSGNAINWVNTISNGSGVGGGNQFVTINGANVDTNFALTPEPGTWLLIAAGAGVLAIARRRKV